MTRNKFYRNCDVVIFISIIASIVSLLLLLRAKAYNDIEMQIVFGSLLVFSLILMVLSLILSLGEYKPTKWPPDMIFPIISHPYEYAIVFLDDTYWAIYYHSTIDEAKKDFKKLHEQNKLHIRVFMKVYDHKQGFYNKELHWS